MVRQSRDGCSPVGSTRTRVPRTAPLAGGCEAIRTPSMPSRETASWIDGQGNAGVDERAEDHVPAGAGKRIEDRDARQDKLSSE